MPQVDAPRLVLRPGAPVLRRDAATLQVGLDAPGRVLLADSPVVRRLLGEMRSTGVAAPRGSNPQHAELGRAMARLVSAGLAIPVEQPRAGRSASPRWSAHLQAARAWGGADASRRLADRGRLRVGLAGPTERRAALARLLHDCGLDLHPADQGLGAAGRSEALDVVVVLAEGEPTRTEIDPHLRHGRPHLVVGSRAGLPRLGPFVVPGTTACLRCVDAHESESDPRRPLLLEQACSERGPAPRDPVLDALATAWVARDLLRYAEGEPPTTWSATVVVAPRGVPQVTRWGRHPQCGCAWDLQRDAEQE